MKRLAGPRKYGACTGEVLDTKKRLAYRLQDRSLSESQRQKLIKDYTDTMLKKGEKTQKSISESGAPAFARPTRQRVHLWHAKDEPNKRQEKGHSEVA